MLYSSQSAINIHYFDREGQAVMEKMEPPKIGSPRNIFFNRYGPLELILLQNVGSL